MKNGLIANMGENMNELYSSLIDTVGQDNRLLCFESPLQKDLLLAHRFYAHEAIGMPGKFTVELLSKFGQFDDTALISKPVALGILKADGQRVWRHGLAQALRYLGADGGWHCWQVDFTSWLALLNYREDCRIWMDRSIIQIFENIFSYYNEAAGYYRFELRNEYPIQSYTTQFNESDFNFLRRWMEHYGIFCYVEYQKDQHTLVFTDDINTLRACSQPAIRFHSQSASQEEDSLLYWQPSRRLHNGRVSFASRDYLHHRQFKRAEERALLLSSSSSELEQYRYSGQYKWCSSEDGMMLARIHMEAREAAAQSVEAFSGVRGLAVGTTFTLQGHPQVDPQESYMVQSLESFAESNLPIAATCKDMPGSLGPVIDEIRQKIQPDGLDDIDHNNVSATTNAHYFNCLICHSTAQAFRLECVTPWPSIGIQTAVVTAPNGQEVYTDKLNRIQVRFNWDRLHKEGDATSCWLRMMQASSGNGWGQIHVPRVGEEVLVGFLDNNIDHPVVLGQVYGEDQPAWHSHGVMSGYRSKELQGNGYNHLLMDDATGQLRTQLASSSAETQLNLGELIYQQGNARGAFRGRGFELRTEAYGALRASQGLYLSSWPLSSGGDQLEARGVWQTLSQGQELSHTLSTTAQQYHAAALTNEEPLKKLSQNAQSRYSHSAKLGSNTMLQHGDKEDDTQRAIKQGAQGEVAGLNDALVVIASPDGIATVTPKNTLLHSGQQFNIVAGEDINLAGGKGLLASLADRFALFVHRAGIKLIAARGKIELQAQSDEIVLDADKTMRITSTKDAVIVSAKKEILLTSGDAYIRIADGDIQVHAPKNISIKGAQKLFDSGASMAQTFNQRPVTSFERKIIVRQHNGKPACHVPYEITREGGGIIRGITDEYGHVELQKSDILENLKIKLLRKRGE